jgi:hypothetical protein
LLKGGNIAELGIDSVQDLDENMNHMKQEMEEMDEDNFEKRLAA